MIRLERTAGGRWRFTARFSVVDPDQVFVLPDGWGYHAPRSFPNRREAVSAAQTVGLGVLDNGDVYADGPAGFIREALRDGRYSAA